MSLARQPANYNVSIISANVEYSWSPENNTNRVQFQNRTSGDIRYAFVPGKVATPTAPYQTLKGNQVYYEINLNTNATIYFAGTAGDVVEIVAWT